MVMPAVAMHVAVCQFRGVGVAHVLYVAGEVEVNPCHRVVEINFHLIQPYPSHHALKMIAMLVGKRQHIAHFQQAVGDFTVHFKNVFRHFHECLFVVFAVGAGCRYAERELVAGLHACQIFFKIRYHHADSVDKNERLTTFGRFHELAVSSAFGQGVVNRHYFFCFDSHL